MSNFEIKDNSGKFLKAEKEAVQRALEKIGLTAEAHAKKECPVDTGRLRNSINHTTDEDSAYIGTNVEYAPYVEYGTSKTAAQPFLRPAATEHSSQYKEILKNELKNA